MLKLIIVRHGQTIKNKEGFAQGHSDSNLTSEGLEQVEKARDYLKNTKIDAVFCSSLDRAVKTAEIISAPHNLVPIIEEDLKEINWGDFSKYPTTELLTKWSEYYEEEKRKGAKREEIRPPNGENSFDHSKRIKKFLEKTETKYKNETILIVGHGGTNKVIIGILRNLDPEQFYTVKQDNACINILELNNDGKILKEDINITKHLSK